WSRLAYLLLGRRSWRTSARRSGWIDRPNSLARYGATVEGRVPRSKSSGVRGKLAALIAYCMARYRLVGVFPQRDTPTRITSAWSSWLMNCPSSCARLKLMASIRLRYCSELAAICDRPTEWLDFRP